MNRENLNKLADYLLSLPEDYKDFDMKFFMSLKTEYSVEKGLTDEGYCWDYAIIENIPNYVMPINTREAHVPNSCGTIACAVGHGPSAGFPILESDGDWGVYSDRVFALGFSDEEIWCFGGGWKYTDNTHYGAAKRIKYLLERGLPENWKAQLDGTEPLCYN